VGTLTVVSQPESICKNRQRRKERGLNVWRGLEGIGCRPKSTAGFPSLYRRRPLFGGLNRGTKGMGNKTAWERRGGCVRVDNASGREREGRAPLIPRTGARKNREKVSEERSRTGE